MAQMSEKEKKDWITLCEYIKYDLLGYSKEMKIPKYLVLRLKGLAEGNFITNKKIAPNACYTYEEILIASKLSSSKIKSYFTNNSAKINDEKHKINLILMFIESEINDVVIRLKNKKATEQEIEKFTLDSYTANQAEYKAETVNAKDKFDELW